MKLRHHRFLLSVLLLALCFALSSCSAAGFVPKSDTTWGELFRHFDSEEFSELDPQLQQMMDEAVLLQEVAENEAQPLTEVGSVAPIYPEEDAEEMSAIMESSIYASAEGRVVNPVSGPSQIFFSLVAYPHADPCFIQYGAHLTTFAECPAICLAVALKDESGNYLAFDCSDEPTALTDADPAMRLFTLSDEFEELENGRSYTIEARAFVLPPEGKTIEGSLFMRAEMSTL